MPQALNSMASMLGYPVRLYWSLVDRMVSQHPDASEQALVERCQLALRVYYGFVFLLAFRWSSDAVVAFGQRHGWSQKLSLHLSSLFPVEQWQLVSIIATVAIALASMLCIVTPGSRIGRVVVAIALPIYWAIQFDMQGKVDHGNHLVIWSAIAFAFLPKLVDDDADDDGRRRTYLGVFLGAAALVGLTYSCAGICKLLGAYYDFPEGQTWFHPDALPLHVAANWKRSQVTLLGPLVLENGALAWLLNQGVLYLELFALPAMFNVRTQRLWGLSLMGMHWGIMLTMKISFANGVMPLVLLLAASPFAPRDFKPVETLKALPVVAFALRRLGRGPQPGDADAGGRPALLRLVMPWILIVYVVVGFSRLDASKPRFEQDIFPISAMPMFWRTRNDAKNVAKLASIRAELRANPRSLLTPYAPPNAKKNKKKN